MPCKLGDKCACGGDTKRVREACSDWFPGIILQHDERANLGYVFLIWGLRNDACDLLAIATSEESRKHQIESHEARGDYKLIKDEKAFVDHAFGSSMLKLFSAMNKRA